MIPLILVLSILNVSSPAWAGERVKASSITFSETTLDNQVHDGNAIMKLEYENWPYKIRFLCMHLDVACGIEESPDDPIFGIQQLNPIGQPQDKLGMNWATQKHTYREVLNSILAKHPSYYWKIDAGVLNVVPRPGKAYSRWWRPLLERKLAHVDADNESATAVILKVADQAGLFSIMRYLSEFRFHQRPIAAQAATDPIIIHLKNVPVREAFNAAVARDGHAIWKFGYDSGHHTFAVKVDSWGRIGEFQDPPW